MKLLPLAATPLRFNISWIFFGNIFYAASQWGMVILLTKLGSSEMVGQFTLGFAITAPVLMLTNLQLRQIQATDAQGNYQFSDYLTLRIVLSSCAVMACLLIAWGAGYRQTFLGAIALVAIAKAIESISDIFFGLFQQQERMDFMGRSLVLKGVLSLVLLCIGVMLSQSVLGGLVGLVMAWGLVLGGYDIPNALTMLSAPPHRSDLSTPARFQLRWNGPTLLKLGRLALPLGAVMMLISLNSNVPNYFVEQQLGAAKLGIFAALSYLTIIGNIVINAVCEAISPRLAKYYASGNRLAFQAMLVKASLMALGFGGILVLAVGWFGQPLLTLIYGEEYGQYQSLLILLMGGAVIRYVSSALGYGMTAARYLVAQFPIFLTVTLVTALACMILPGTYGLMGIGGALLIGAIVQFLISLGVILHAVFRCTRPLTSAITD
jgi:O-antigen/teichoic acid export membrane protein